MNIEITLEDIKRQKERVIELRKERMYFLRYNIQSVEARKLDDILHVEKRHLLDMVLECSEL